MLNYLTVLVCTKTIIIHRSVGGYWLLFTSPFYGLGKYPPLATSTSVNNNCYILITRFELLELLLSKQPKRITLISLTWNWLKINELVPELNVTFTQLYEYIVGPIRMSLQLNDNVSFTSSPSNLAFTSKVASEHAHCPLDPLVRKVKLKN